MSKRKGSAAAQRYVAVYRRDPEDEHAWLVHIEGMQECHTYGRSISAARARIREAIGLFVDGKVEIADRLELPKELKALVSEASRARGKLEEARRQHVKATKRAVQKLAAKGISTRDAGEVLDYSQQRIAQLIAR